LQILLASNNENKRSELSGLLEPLAVDVVPPAGVGGLSDVDEDRDTFGGNAAKKAVAAALDKNMWALADDSGLEVEHLGGAPGVRSARFAGAHGDDAANNALLLERLAGVEDHRRGARFVCALALSRPDGTVALEVSGEARGRMLDAPRGGGGFGYDPLFLFTEEGFEQTGRSFAELSNADKADVSHRGRALRELVARLPDVLSAGT
jgi:XTP/dITP diphosphohydrolase